MMVLFTQKKRKKKTNFSVMCIWSNFKAILSFILLFFIVKMSSVYLQGLGRSGALSSLPSQEGSECLSGSSLTKAAICFTYVYCFYIWV